MADLVSNCCSAYEFGAEDYGLCPNCKEHCDFIDLELDEMAYSIASHDNLAQEVIYLMQHAEDLTIEQQWELVDAWVSYRS